MSGKQFETLSFWQLLENRSVEIPIIQRDYAQGRENKQKVRDSFLDALYGALTDNPIELDFVYGNEENNVLQPLDGQQRLTTLFLLHWFVANKEGTLDSTVKQRLSKFTYETRTSSREFCKELVKKGVDYKNLLSPDVDKKNISKRNELSKTICDNYWFVDSWRKDPTISAMLTMLDAIQARFSNKEGLWEKLTATENPPITFLHVPLNNFGLSDDLYIKMNARGKQLTPFENFKAIFEKHVKKHEWEKDQKKFDETFSFKIDTIWTDLFWKYRGNDGLIDNEMINFIAGLAINRYAYSYTSTDKDKIESRIKELSDNPNEINPQQDFSTQESFEYLINCLNKYSEQPQGYPNSIVKPNILLWNNGSKDTSLFEGLIVGENFTMQKRVMFYAQTSFLLNKEFNQDEFNDFMRVIRNVIENATGNWNIERMIGAFRFVTELMNEYKSYDKDIYSVLANTKVTFLFNSEQIKEEIEKAKIIVVNPAAKQVIHETEDTNFCKGRIGFALYCINFQPIPTNFNQTDLSEVKVVIEKYLSGQDITNEFRRGLLTIGDNKFYNYWRSWLYALDVPKKCLIESIEEMKDYAYNSDYKQYLKELVIQLIQKPLSSVISDYQIPTEMPEWKKRLIKEPTLLDYSSKHYIAVEDDDSQCWLIPSSKVANTDEGRNKCKKL